MITMKKWEGVVPIVNDDLRTDKQNIDDFMTYFDSLKTAGFKHVKYSIGRKISSPLE